MKPVLKSLDAPDERPELPKSQVDLVTVDGHSIMRLTPSSSLTVGRDTWKSKNSSGSMVAMARPPHRSIMYKFPLYRPGQELSHAPDVYVAL